jgi:8-amino-3,8-dideoxy-alpha-D-manno-octulosonate transaminase
MSKVLTAGEGGMVTTSDQGIAERAAMFHDAAAGRQMRLPPDEWLPGLNLRMSELHAAVLLVQLDRLDGLVTGMRARRRRLEQLTVDRLCAKGVRFRTVNDPDGDTSIALIFFLPGTDRTKRVVAALADENIPAAELYRDPKHAPPGEVDLHAYPAWAPLLGKRIWSRDGGPWRWHPRSVEYDEAACPATLDLLRRAVHVDVSPELSDEQVEQMGAAIAGVVERLV